MNTENNIGMRGNQDNVKTNKGCGTFILMWASVSVIIGIILNAINETGQKIGELIFLSIFLGAMIAFVVFCFKMIIVTSGKKNKSTAITQFINPYVDVHMYDEGDEFPEVHYSNVFLKQGEQLIYAVPAQTFIEKEQVVGYTGGSAGVSVRVAKGVSIRSGSTRGRAVRQNVYKFNEGDYVITNKRILFVSQSGGFEFDVKKISVLKIVANDAFIIAQGNKQKNICVDLSQVKYAFGLTRFAANSINDGISDALSQSEELDIL